MPFESKTVQGHPLFRDDALFRADSLNEEKRTVDLVWTTGHKGERRDFWGDRWMEELSVDEDSVRLDRLNAGAPLLNAHMAYDLDSVIGVVERAWIENGFGIATVRFSERAGVEDIFRDVKSGVLRNVSVGYRVYKWEREEPEGELVTLRATDWEPFEVSMVPIGFDPGAQTRSYKGREAFDMQIITREIPMGKKEGQVEATETRKEPVQEPAKSAEPAVDLDAVRREAQAAERKRVALITDLCGRHNANSLRQKLIEDGADEVTTRAVIMEHLAAKTDETEVRTQHSGIQPGSQDEILTMREAVSQAFLHRYDPSKFESTEPANEYRGMSLLEVARRVLERRGERTAGLSKMGLAERAFHSTSDFPNILVDTMNKTLRMAYEDSPRTFQPIVRVTELPDFRQVTRAQFGEGPDLDEIEEGGEYTRGTVSDSKEVYRLTKYGKVMAVTYETLVNDDLSAFTRLPAIAGARAAGKESDIVWSIITDNAAMNDGTVLFHADHGNLAAGADVDPINVSTLGAAMAAMRTQTGLDGHEINVIPRYLIVPAAQETVARQYMGTIEAAEHSKINPWAGAFRLIVEPRLDADSTTAWYLAAEPSQIDTIELAFLQGERGVQTFTRQGFDVDGLEFKMRLVAGAKAIDWRGLYKNAGT